MTARWLKRCCCSNEAIGALPVALVLRRYVKKHAEQFKALLRSFLERDDAQFLSVAMQVAASEARRGQGKLAEEIKEMARVRPENAPALLEQARHLIELAEQIRNDWLRRQGTSLKSLVMNAGGDGGAAAVAVAPRDTVRDEFGHRRENSRF